MAKVFFTGWRLLGTLLVLAGALVLCGLGVWQINRLNQRLALNERIDERMAAAPVPLNSTAAVDPDVLDYQRVVVRGTFDPSQEIVLRNRSYQDSTGVNILTPLRLSGNDKAVLINRGWIPIEVAARQARRQFAPPNGEVVVEGVARRSQDPTVGPQDPPFGPDRPRLDAWFHVNIPRIQQQIPYSLLPVFVEEQPEPGTALLPARSATTDLGPGPHLSYAIQWFSFAIILVVGYIAFTWHQTDHPRQKMARG